MICRKCEKRPARLKRKICINCSYPPGHLQQKRRNRKAAGGCKLCLKKITTSEFGCCCSSKCRDRMRAFAIKQRRALKIKVMMAYGGAVCACPKCPERDHSHIEFLTIDHIDGGGNRHKKSIGLGSSNSNTFYRWLRDNKYPQGFQVLCFNCNSGRYINGGVCPHLNIQPAS